MIHYAMGSMCARCRVAVDPDRDCLGESGIYSPNRAFTLCEECEAGIYEAQQQTVAKMMSDKPGCAPKVKR